MTRLILLLILNLIVLKAHCQDKNQPWEFLQTTDNITVFMREIPDTKIKELKLTTIFNNSALKLIETLKDVKKMPTWCLNCRYTKPIKRIGNNEIFFYYLANIPWPITNQDLVLHLNFSQDPTTKVYTVTSNNFDGLVPINKGINRVEYMKANWKITPLNANQTNVEYSISLEISNAIPDWIIKKAISYSPIKSINSLKEIIKNPL